MSTMTDRQQRTWAIVGVSLFLGLVFDNFFYGHIPGITIFLYAVLILAGLGGLAYYQKTPLSLEAKLLFLPILFFSGMTFVRESDIMSFFNVVTVLYLLLLLAKLSHDRDKKVSHYWLKDYFWPVLRLPLRFIRYFFNSLNGLFQPRSQTVSAKRYPQIAKGLVITIPILLLFLLLFMSADLVFQKAVTSVFNFHISSVWVGHLALIAFIMAGFMGSFGFIFNARDNDAGLSPEAKKPVQLGTIESLMLLGSLNVLFLFFIIIQFTYLFGGQQNVQGAGFTYAQYARKGFFELIVVALLTQLVLWVIHKTAVHKSLNRMVQTKVFSVALIGQAMIIMLSALKRLGLYEQAYGFTTLRFFSHLFIFWLAVVFILLAYHLVSNQKEQRLAILAFLATLAFLAIANLMNPDAFIAQENIARYQQTGKIDLYYLRTLSADAVPPINNLLTAHDPAMQKAAATVLYQLGNQVESRDDGWQSTHLSRRRATKIFEAHKAQLERDKDYISPFPDKFRAD